MNSKLALPVIALALAVPAASFAQAFGAASSYNVFVTGNFSSSGSDTEGRLAAGGNVNVSSYDVGLLVSGGSNTGIVSGGSVSFSGGQVTGNVVSKNGSNLTNFAFRNSGSAVTGASAVNSVMNFGQTASYLQNASTQWGDLANNGLVESKYGGVYFTGYSNTLNVFNITAAQLESGSYYTFNIPSGSTTLFNVTGTTVNFAKNTSYDVTGSKTVWNLKNATSANFKSLDGSVLAPYAAISANGGRINGQILAGSYDGQTQINNVLFTGESLPPVTNAVPEPASMIALGIGGLALIRRRRASKK
ncbi:choice-of-anchor A family protein [bacterium]|nr:MAG: choice-of-anchor A family protein [bacterium]